MTSRATTARDPIPPLDPAAYNQLCQKTPTAPDCGLPLYWPAPPSRSPMRQGCTGLWDLRYAPIAGIESGGGGGDAMGAVPHRTYPSVNAPWAPPGTYMRFVSPSAARASRSRSCSHLDPRVTTPATGLAEIRRSRARRTTRRAWRTGAYAQARALIDRLDSAGTGSDIEPTAPRWTRSHRSPLRVVASVRRRRGPPTLSGAASALVAAAMAMQGADVTPTAKEVAACEHAREQYRIAMQRWAALKTSGLAALNASRKAAGQPEIKLPPVPADEVENPARESSQENEDEG